MEYLPLVSVLIPTYNAAQFLEEAIESVLNQTFTDFELIIVDNQSTDNTEEVVAPYLVDVRVKYYKNEANLGMGGNWNRCLQFAKGNYIKFLCADDKIHPQLLEKYVPILNNYPEVSLVTSYRQAFFDMPVIQQPAVYHPPFPGIHPGETIIRESLLTLNWIGEPTSVMFRRKNLWVGYFRVEMKWLLDWDMWLRHLAVGKFYLVPEVLAFFRLHENQGTKLVALEFLNYFEEYYYLKSIRDLNPFPFLKNDRAFMLRVRNKGAYCGEIIPKLIWAGKYDLAKKALNIVLAERVISRTVFLILRKFLKQIFLK